jgi:hypothetical protein
LLQIHRHHVHALIVGPEAVEAQLVAYKQRDQDGRRKADGQPDDVDGTVEPVAGEIAQRRNQVTTKHRSTLFISERRNGVRPGNEITVDTDRGEGDHESRHGGSHHQPRVQRYMFGKSVQPAVHEQPCTEPGDCY